jgi:hypothetical protein
MTIIDWSRCQTAENLLTALDDRIGDLQTRARDDAIRNKEYMSHRSELYSVSRSHPVEKRSTGREGGKDGGAAGAGMLGMYGTRSTEGRMWVRFQLIPKGLLLTNMTGR